MTDELLPCPFCGEVRISLNKPNKYHSLGSINCPACMVLMPGATNDENELVECWNHRTAVSRPAVRSGDDAHRRKLLSRLASSLSDWRERPQYDTDTAAEIILGDLERVGIHAPAQASLDLALLRDIDTAYQIIEREGVERIRNALADTPRRVRDAILALSSADGGPAA